MRWSRTSQLRVLGGDGREQDALRAYVVRGAASRRCVGGAVRGLASLVALLACSAVAHAEESSPIAWQVELKLGPYKASVDDELADAKPFETVYGDNPVLMGMGEIDYQFWRRVGSLAVGFSAGYALDNGTAVNPKDGSKTGDTTRFQVVPMQLSLVYHFDYLAVAYDIPFVPFAKAGLDYWIWWIEDASGEVATVDGSDALGGNFGWHVGGGLKLLLDWFDPDSATAFDLEMGVNHSYLFAEFVYARVDDFGSSSAMRIGDGFFLFGISFEL